MSAAATVRDLRGYPRHGELLLARLRRRDAERRPDRRPLSRHAALHQSAGSGQGRGGEVGRGEKAPAQADQVHMAQASGEPHRGAGHQARVAGARDLKTARARAMTEAMQAVYACPDRGSAAIELDRLTS